MPALRPTLATLLLAASTASAAITIPTVLVGDAGNSGDVQPGQGTFGAVSYDYHIGTYEVTNSQYTAFLNAVASTDTHSLYNVGMNDNSQGGITRVGDSGSYTYSVKSGFDNKPVNYVSFWDAARFANWLTNGQPTGSQGSGTTEDGAYTLTSSGISNNTVTRGSWYDVDDGNTSSETVFAVASEDEWYKAAYYDGNGGYYEYPTQSDTAPNPSGPTAAANSANYMGAVNSVTEVGAYPNSGSHYGTFDQGGNVREWNDEIISNARVLRGGADEFSFVNKLQSSFRTNNRPTFHNSFTGFRVSSLAPIPEPSSYGAIFGIVGLAAAVFFRRRRRRE